MIRLTLLLLLVNCCLPVMADDPYVIQAKISGVKDGNVFFLKRFDTQKIVNAMKIEKGEFLMRGTLGDIPQHLWLCATINDEFHYCDLLIDKDTLFIEGSIADFPNGLRFRGAATHMGYAGYLEQTHALNQRIDSLSKVSMYLHEIKATGIKRPGDKSESIKRSSFGENMDKYAGQFLLTRIMKQLSMDSLRQFYRLVPVEMKKTKFTRVISNYINPYADNCIRQADDLLRLQGKDLDKYAEEACKLYEQGVRLDPERTDGYIALAMMYERLLPVRGVGIRGPWWLIRQSG